ncbi:MAG TPA: hypothetical protein VM734_17740 [Kofleriaceae bacterium]|nr:hypothetical protein [Kofleriaceae bacterium]
MRTGIVMVLAAIAAGCAARAPSVPAGHPADPAAKAGRLAGPPAILRVRPADQVAPAPAPAAHDHGSHAP